MDKTALIIVDVQNDFLPGGSLAVPEGDKVIPVIQSLLNRDQWSWAMVVASQDYHPEGHISFATTHAAEPFSNRTITNARGKKHDQTMWPDHCVVGTKGAEIERELRHSFEPWKDSMRIVRKGWHKEIEAYSAFEGYITDPSDPKDEPPRDLPNEVESKDSELAQCLRQQGVGRVVVTGLATDYCVKQTASSAIKAGFITLILAPAMKGIDADGIKTVYEELEAAGGKIVGREEEGWEEGLKIAISEQ